MTLTPFEIRIPDAELADLRHRLRSTRWADDFANADWAYGMSRDYLEPLVAYWRDDYDWRAQERAMNAWPHFRTEVDGIPIHFLHARGRGPRPIPLILTHGWPWTFWDFAKVIGPLTDPAAHGGDPADAFDVVVPSLPGHGFSSPLRTPGINAAVTADLWRALMVEQLGYPRFAAHGADWGAYVTAQLGHKYAADLHGVHIVGGAPLDCFTNPPPALEDYAPDELAFHAKSARALAKESGYFALQTTKPQTIAFALNDSPVGLAAWLIEKRRAWSDCGGDVARRFTRDELLTHVMIYWLTGTYGTSARFYYELIHNPWTPSHDRTPMVEAPTAFLRMNGDAGRHWPRKSLEANFNVQRFAKAEDGGHFAAAEAPELVVSELRAFFRPMR